MEMSKLKLGLIVTGALVAGYIAYGANQKRKLNNQVDGLIANNPDLF